MRRLHLSPPVFFLFGGLALFFATLGYLISALVLRPDAPVFAPSPIAPDTTPPLALVHDTITVDARDEHEWRYVNFSRRSVVVPPDTGGWSLAVRRFQVETRDAVVDLGSVPFHDVRRAPTASLPPPNPRTRRHRLDQWYRYSWLTHLLTPTDHVYAARTGDGRYAKFAFLSYYCPGLVSGCVTLQYSYQPSGEPTFE